MITNNTATLTIVHASPARIAIAPNKIATAATATTMTAISFQNVNIEASRSLRGIANGTVRLVAVPALSEARQELLADPALRGYRFCLAYAKAADEWLNELADAATGGTTKGVALLAVGGYGRGELSPYSDLDLVLVHDGVRKIETVADRLWYPIWDAGIRLDHSVRKPKEVFKVAEEDLRVALGLLDARLVYGDANVATPLIERVRSLWSTQWGDQWLPELERQMVIRHEMHGDLADLLEPDLKEAHGGLRDLNVLGAVRWAFPDVERIADFDEVHRARDVLLDARVALHRLAARELDRLLLQEQDQVAVLTGAGDADELMQSISQAARVVARTSDAAWRHRDRWRRRGSATPPFAETVEDGIEFYDGEVRLAASAPTTSDPTLTLRLAAVAAEVDRPISFDSLTRLAEDAPAVPEPWPSAVLRAFVRLLSAGNGLVAAVEALDAHDLFSRHLPEWRYVHSYHQRNAYHRFTVDRHLLEAVLHARQATSQVSRPDLLLLGVLLHDIGKGHPGDHTDVGVELARTIGPRIGLRDDDANTLVQLVRHHLLLADIATRRDLDDPSTLRYVAAAVGDEQTLELLTALSRADGLATGPSAWGPWKAQLVDDLSARVKRILQGHDHVAEPHDHRDLADEVARDGLVVRREDDWVVVATPDQPGLLSVVTAALSLLSLDVRSADLATVEGVAVDRFFCAPGTRGWPDAATLRDAIAQGLNDREDLFTKLSARAASYPTRRRSAQRLSPGARVVPGASEAATVVEIVALDEVGLVSRLARILSDQHIDITAARLSTVGEIAIDTFYLRGPDGRPLAAAALAQALASLDATVGAPVAA
jgi:[protein-PII] uridylyltransferase